jgi:integral membrane sensor domain MASE1
VNARSVRQGAILFALVAAGYVVGYKLAQEWFSAANQGASFFPPAGVTLAALVLTGRRQWPIVLAAAAAAEITLDTLNGVGVVPALGYALANTAEPLVGALLLTTMLVAVDLSRTRHLIAFVGSAVITAPIVGGVIAATTFVYVDDNSGWARFAFEWWSGDGLGVLVVGGALLSLALVPQLTRRSAGEAALVAAVAVFATYVVFELGHFEFIYVPVALLVVLAFRAGAVGVAVTAALVAFLAAGATAEARHFWETLNVTPANRVLYLQLALAVLITTCLALAAEIAERERVVARLARSESSEPP